jgi:hypothetical protein
LRFPVLKIDMPSSRIYVMNDVPGNRRDVAVPWPYGRVGMAIVAGAFQNRLHFRGHIHVRFETPGRGRGRVRPAWLNDLNQDQKNDGANRNPLSPDASHTMVSPGVLKSKLPV